jgi:CCR4-NOT transcription complex subunit 2
MHVLALGTDLTTFGLNLNAADNLYTSFLSPFTDGSQSDEPQFKTPQCYLMSHPPVLKADHWSKLQPETLFYIFYQMPKDILQACAAQELYRRDWRYHAELKIWLKPHRQPNDIIQPQTLQFLYFDAKSWEQKILNASQIRGNLLAGLIPEEEIRVKVPMPGQNPIVEPS